MGNRVRRMMCRFPHGAMLPAWTRRMFMRTGNCLLDVLVTAGLVILSAAYMKPTQELKNGHEGMLASRT